MRLPACDLAAGVRAYIATSSGGALVAMLVAPSLLHTVAASTFILCCGAIMMASGTTGLLRHRGHVEAEL
ncbi:MAG: hypothetical protein ACRYF2_03280 [Janthinobacterium lividum]